MYVGFNTVQKNKSPNQPKIPSQKESANKISADKLQINLVSF